ncbi:NAD-dependent epimerase/dehydratase family protein [Pedobacter frigiditerrae]|uniref:NAD-dependent epimerase/dehydratase family protein n=1 Tax=Pedobacter frigiditerrae TaxID=2530452 RepID=UPI00293144A7|nr:NAD-dependent epimerase/dehydratase family protein [Pedobacter frigiditerrae]
MKILLLGGTGAMGIHLIKLLSKDGVELVVTSRKNRPPVGRTRFIKGNAHDVEFLRGILSEGWDVIIDFMIYTTPIFEERINTLLIATNQYVFLSSARVYADSQQPMLETGARLLDTSEDKEFLSTDEYSLSKARQEDILMKSEYKNWTIVRPYITYSEKRLQLSVLEKEEWLYRALKGRSILVPEKVMAKLTTLTYGFNVAEGIAALIRSPVNTLGESFHITHKKSITWNEVLLVYSEVLEAHMGRKPKILLQRLDKFFEFKPAKYQMIYDRLYDRQFETGKIDQFIDSAAFIHAKVGLEACLRDFLSSPEFNEINWASEAIKDKQAREFTPLREISGIKQKLRYLIYRFIKN